MDRTLVAGNGVRGLVWRRRRRVRNGGFVGSRMGSLVRSGMRRRSIGLRLVFRVDGSSLVFDIGDVAIVVVGSVGHSLDAAVGKVDLVGAGDDFAISGFMGIEIVTGIFINDTVFISVRFSLLFVWSRVRMRGCIRCGRGRFVGQRRGVRSLIRKRSRMGYLVRERRRMRQGMRQRDGMRQGQGLVAADTGRQSRNNQYT